MHPTPLYRAYAAATRAALPVAWAVERAKLRKAGVAPERWREKLGHASLPRPEGQVIWFHAASVGESLSVLSLIERIGHELRGAEFLITSGTATSAKMVASRLPPRARHQFAPLDAAGPLRRFLRHWQPDAAVLVESELWPQMLWRTHRSGARMALLNARMSERSVARWAKHPETARQLLSVFRLILTQNAHMARAMVRLGAEEAHVRQGVNLKSMSAPLPVDDATLTEMRAALAGRPVWVASSTHEGEEQEVLEAHAALRADHPGLCLILAPRHPERSDAVAALIAARGWADARRSAGAVPGPDVEVYLADTLGELGTWYALTDVVFLGGSLLPIGGHNPYEVAQAGAAVVSGVHVANFAETFSGLEAAGGADLVKDASGIARVVGFYLADPAARQASAAAAKGFCTAQDNALDDVAAHVIKALDLDRSRPFA